MNLEPAFTLDVALAPPLEIGRTSAGVRRVIPITGGTFDGPLLRGTILPGGADWNLVRPDGVVHLWARYTLQTDAGHLVMITNEGWGTQDDETMMRVFSGQDVDRSEWYCHTHPVFEAGPEAPRWLSESVFTGTLRAPTRADQVVVDVFRIT